MTRATLGVIVACLVMPRRSLAAETNDDWLSWHAPPECQNTREVERQLESLLGHEVEAAQLPRTSVQLSWDDSRGWHVRVRVQQSGASRRRQVHTESCSDAYDIVALTLALILDPELLGGESQDAEQDLSHTPTEPPAPEGDTSSAEAEATGDSLRQWLSPQAGTDSPPALPEQEREANVPASAPPSWDEAHVRAAGLARVDLSSLSAPLWGGGAELALRLGSTELSIAGELLVSGETRLRRAVYPVEYGLGFGRLGACRYFPVSGLLSWSLCGAGQLGSLSVNELGGQQLRASGLWGALGIGSGLGANVTDRLRADLSVSLVFPMFRHELSLTSGELAHTLPPVSLQMALAVGFDMTD